MRELAALSARSLAHDIASMRISSVEATKAALERLTSCHELTNCIISLDSDEALRIAKATDAAIAKGIPHGPLAGVPLAHKDMFDRTGKIASWGAQIHSDRPAQEDATVIARLNSAGSIQIAALHLTEFAFGPTGHNYVLGHARNPWDPTRITGGSSAGTASAVAFGAIPAGLGSDTGGSLRLPAAACGIASIKPTWGRISRAGAMPLAPSLDTIGVIARHVEDLALLLGLLAGPDPRDPAASTVAVPDYLARLEETVSGSKIGIDERLIREADPGIQKLVEMALDVLAKAGIKRAVCEFEDWPLLDHMVQLIQLPEASACHAGYLRQRPNDYGPQVRARVEVGHFIHAVDYLTALRARGAIVQRTLERTFKDIDAAILPVFADPVQTIAELDVAGGPTLQATMARVVKYTRPINYLGLPAITLPVPRSGGLPNGVQIIARPYAEAQLLAIGQAYQREVPPELAKRLA
jgi:aspartyl-tRNA(Asn)/glutamyl-tRNA(Gln) amidotransferase subunit A